MHLSCETPLRPPRRVRTWLGRGLAGAALAWSAMACADSSSIIIEGKDNWLFPGWGSLTHVDTAGIDASAALVTEVRSALMARDIRLVVVLLPDKARFYQDKLPDGKSMSADVAARYQTVLGRLRQAGVPSFDDEAVLLKLRNEGRDVYYRTDQHWTQAAADATARATAEMVAQQVPKLAGQPGSGMALGALSNERRYGDLAELFLTPERKKAVGRETFTIRKTAGNQGLLDDAAAPVHVTGHSMVQPYFGYPQMLSNTLDRPVSVNWKPGNVGPWVMLLEYLESPAFRQQPPQVLVWQLFEPAFSQGPDARGLWDNASLMSADTWRKRLQAAVGR
ncbi:alginate O-acetyltransferase AlgX-related protein [Cupriavidus sp. YAF13]|uniref:alginate O-acetyltransferase AlgX-related protein n=1 Tax=Cupriavidus sp. YAF13 TaxID=3233075 RepID=UPI003F8E35EC